MEKRTIIAFLLIFLVYWFSSQFLWRTTPVQTTEEVEERRQEQADSTPLTRERPVFEEHAAQESQLFYVENMTVNDGITIRNDHIEVRFTNLGGLINQITLKDFYLYDKRTPVALIPDGQSIMQVNFPNHPLGEINEMVFEYELTESRDSQTVRFSLINPEANSIFRKIFTLREGYNLDFQIQAENIPSFESYSVSVNSGINITERSRAAEKDMRNSFKFVGQIDREVRDITLHRLSRGEQTFSGNVNWAAVRSKYFVMSLISPSPVRANSVRTQRISDTLGFDVTVSHANRQSMIHDNFELYLGPINIDILRAFNMGKENIAELSWRWLRPLSQLFMFYISFLYRHIPNYGVVIIIFAFTLKVLLSPLTKKSLTAGKKMQQIQPLMREIQTKYKNDPKKQQEELRKMYAEHKVNPLGGCLPILLQMPVFFALFPVLRSSIEFRQAHFVGWLTDLSEPDPYYILPILMGAFMFLQQKMMQTKQDTSNMDEKQLAMVQSQKMMMYLLPPFMVFIFSGFPSGLVLYWTTYNVFSIIMQYFLNKKNKTEIEVKPQT